MYRRCIGAADWHIDDDFGYDVFLPRRVAERIGRAEYLWIICGTHNDAETRSRRDRTSAGPSSGLAIQGHVLAVGWHLPVQFYPTRRFEHVLNGAGEKAEAPCHWAQ